MTSDLRKIAALGALMSMVGTQRPLEVFEISEQRRRPNYGTQRNVNEYETLLITQKKSKAVQKRRKANRAARKARRK